MTIQPFQFNAFSQIVADLITGELRQWVLLTGAADNAIVNAWRDGLTPMEAADLLHAVWRESVAA